MKNKELRLLYEEDIQISFPCGVIEINEAINIITNTKQNANPHVSSILPYTINIAEIMNPIMLVTKNESGNGSEEVALPNSFSALMICSFVRGMYSGFKAGFFAFFVDFLAIACFLEKEVYILFVTDAA